MYVRTFYFKTFLFLSALVLCSNAELTLKKVVILSRHNVRTPLSKTLSQTSPKKWPQWNEKPGYLTQKGVLLEGFMGEYFSQWLKKEGLIQGCPDSHTFYVYANTAQRTLASAKAFVLKAFPACNITIHHAASVDPIFNPVIHNKSRIFLNEALNIMKNNIKSLHLNESLEMLDWILDYKCSENCIKDSQCDLVTDKNMALLRPGSKPNINGPLKICKSAIDSFIMENYEGFNQDEVAWGLLTTEEKWRIVLEVSLSYHNIIFNSTIIAKDISEPLVHFMTNLLKYDTPRVSLLMGHDANVYTILNAMGFKSYKLDEQHEATPVGGKIVFQKWSDNGTEFLKIDYVYQSTKDMRDGVLLSLDRPPIFKQLELEACKANAYGFCLWDDFVKLLDSL